MPHSSPFPPVEVIEEAVHAMLIRDIRAHVKEDPAKVKNMPFSSPFPLLEVIEETMHAKLIRAIRAHGKEDPERVALVSAHDESSRLTYAELLVKANAMQAFLQSREEKRGDVVTFVHYNCIEGTIVSLGTWMSGCVISGASAFFTAYELVYQLADSRASVVVSDEEHLERVLEAARECEHVKTIVCIRDKGSSFALPECVVDFADVMALHTDDAPVDVPCNSLASLPYSSGTTGAPKGVMLSHVAIGTGAEIFRSQIVDVFGPVLTDGGQYQITKEYFLLNLALYHQFGFMILKAILLGGATAVVMKKFDDSRLYCAMLQKYKISLAFATPPLILLLAKESLTADYDLTSLRAVNFAGAPVFPAVADEFLAKYPHVRVLAQGYGLTEAGACSHFPDLCLPDAHLCAGLPAPNFEHKIVDFDTGAELPDGSSGELCVRSPTLMLGYLNRPEATAETIDKDGWLHTGDKAHIDSHGRMKVVGRFKELIKVFALQVPPIEIEDVLMSHEHVRDAAVVGVPDKERGEIIRAYIVRREKNGEESVKEEELLELVKKRLAHYKHITGGLVFVDELPKNGMGKVLRRELKEQALRECGLKP